MNLSGLLNRHIILERFAIDREQRRSYTTTVARRRIVEQASVQI